jgi:hypothetical protein
MKPVLDRGTNNKWPGHIRFPPYTQDKANALVKAGKFGNVYMGALFKKATKYFLTIAVILIAYYMY